MPKNNSKARKDWRKNRVEKLQQDRERFLLAIFGEFSQDVYLKPGTDQD